MITGKNPERIELMLSLIEEMWLANPELRLCQLLGNAMADTQWHGRDLYYLEDIDLYYKLIEMSEMFDKLRKESKMNENEYYQFDELTESIVGICEGIEKEVSRQLKLWGTEFDDKNTANDWSAYITNYVSKATYSGREEEYSPEKFKENMKKAAAICVSAIAAVERNGDCAPRHYEDLPNSGAKTNA